MIPILYESSELKFTSNGIGRLSSAISCTVTEERNGGYELEMKYPISGHFYEEIKISRIIWALPADGKSGQGFRIYKISRPISGIVTVYAEHISYQLSSIPTSRFSANSAAEAMIGLKENAASNCPFEFWTDVTTAGSFSVEEPESIRSRLGGSDGSVLDVFGGEYEWDNCTVKLRSERGLDSGVTLRYGKNITDLTQEENITNTITGIYPYWKDSEAYVELNQKVVLAENAGNFPYPRIVTVDCSGEFEKVPSQDELLTWAQKYVKKAGIGIPKVSIEVSFVALWQTEEYKNIAPLERVGLCDTVTIEYEKLGVSAKAKVIKTVYNVLLERYESIEIGDAKSSISSTIASQQQEIEGKPSTSFLQAAVNNATKWITGTNGGYVVLHKNGNDQPYELLIMNTDDINTATEVWRWNKGGLGFSSNGYNGPYATAITQDGKIVANFIATGTMLANIIKGGTLTLGGSSNGNGVIRVLNASGTEIGRWDKDGIKATKGTFSGSLSAASGTFSGDMVLSNVADSKYPIIIQGAGGVKCGIGPSAFLFAFNGHYVSLDKEDGVARFSGGTYSSINSNLSMAGKDSKMKIDSDGMIKSEYTYNTVGASDANVHVTSSGIFTRTGSSSRRYKTDESEDLGAFDPEALLRLPVKVFKYKPGYLKEDDPQNGQFTIGFIVEDMEEIYPHAVQYENGLPEMWNSKVILPAMLKLIQRQEERIKKLEEML